MKINEVINEAETNAEKNRRHQKDLDDLERSIRKSGNMDKDTEAAFNKKRRELAHNRSKIKEMDASSVAVVSMPVGPTISRQMKNKDGTVKNALDMDTNIMGQKKKSKKKKA